MNELANLINIDTSGWMCSGDDTMVTAKLFKGLLNQAVSKQLIQVVIASEDMVPTVSQIVESDAKTEVICFLMPIGISLLFLGEMLI